MSRLEKAINDFCIAEYGSEAGFEDRCAVPILYTTTEGDELEMQIYCNLDELKVVMYVDWELVKEIEFNTEKSMAEYAEYYMTFDDLYAEATDAYWRMKNTR